MKIVVLGATGHVGHLLVSQALAAGHHVTAIARNPAKITLQSPDLTVVSANLRDPASLAPVIGDCDAVLSALGHGSLKTSDIQTAATRTVLACLKPHQRFISLTGTGVSDPEDVPPTLGARLVTWGIKLVPGELYLDGLRHVQLLRESHADWVVVRSPPMTGGPVTPDPRVGFFPIKLTSTVSRATVAAFMLANLTTDKWLCKAPLITSR